MSENLDRMSALYEAAYPKEGGFGSREALDKLYAMKFTTEMLEADIEHGNLGLVTHSTQARELLKLNDAALRQRAWNEAHTLQNIRGGVMSHCLWDAVCELKVLLAEGRLDDELYGERFARVAREKEAELRKRTGNPGAIYYPEFPAQRRY